MRANYQLLDIPADFRLGSQNEIDLLEEDVAVQTIEQNYEDNDGSFSDLVELVSSGRDDKGLQDTLHRLYGFVRSHPFYREWLDEKLLMAKMMVLPASFEYLSPPEVFSLSKRFSLLF